MEEERVKSALELAMERISAMPELTPEEIAAQKEKQYGPLGEALAGRYLSGLVNEDELPEQIEKLPVEQRLIVRRALISGLCRTLQLEGDLRSAEKALIGLRHAVSPKASYIEKAAEDYWLIVRELSQEKEKQSAAIEAAALKPLGIGGTAVRCNPAENLYWTEELKKLRQLFEPRLKSLRLGLLQELQKS